MEISKSDRDAYLDLLDDIPAMLEDYYFDEDY